MFGLTPYEKRSMNLFNQFDDLERELFGLTKMNSFRTDIKDEDSKFVVETELPGFKKEDITLDIEGDVLTITAQHNEEKEDKKDGKFLRRERSYSAYKRSYDVSTVQTDDISVKYEAGILTIDMPKKEPVKPQARRLEIK
jgi:HSP20 family protein